MNILFIATESSPYYRTGDLADVVYGLAKELCVQGHDARIIVPRYRTTTQEPSLKKVLKDLEVNLGDYSRMANLLKTEGKPDFYFVEQSFYFSRDELYGYTDDYARFIFFTRFALDMLSSGKFQEQEENWFPQIIQGYDWATGLIPKWLADYREKDDSDARFKDVRFSLFVHNILRLGKFGSQALSLAESKDNGFYKQTESEIYEQVGESPNQMNFLGRGILFADQVITVNPDFSSPDDPHPDNPLPKSAEILRNVLENRLQEDTLKGIVSGIDAEEYDPASDGDLKCTFIPARIEQRIENKLALQKELNFKPDKDIPLLGMVSRLIPENGFDLLLEMLKEHRDDLGEFQLAVLAAPGNPDYQKTLEQWDYEQNDHAPWIKSRFGFVDKLARRIYAGCDIYLIPAKELPTDINQLIAMRYGAIPVAHYTGALCKTILNYHSELKLRDYRGNGMGIGFMFKRFSQAAFLETLKVALDLYRGNNQVWRELQLFNIRERFTWARHSDEYLDCYEKILQLPPRKVFHGKNIELSREVRLRQALEEIGNLPGIDKRSSVEIFKPTARLIRWVLSCDAVYIRGVKSDFEKPSSHENIRRNRDIIILERSITRQHGQQPNEEQILALLNQSTDNTRRHLGDVDREGICQPISSKITQDKDWRAGWSIPVLAYGHMFGWIDVLFQQKIEEEGKAWIVSALTSLANAFGLRLDTFRIADEMDLVSKMGIELLETRSIDDVVLASNSWVEKLFPGSRAWVYLVENGALKPFNNSKNDAITLAQRALENGQTVYVADWNEAPRGENNRRLYRSVLAIPLMPSSDSRLTNINAVLTVISERPAAFTREDENLLSRYLSPQVYAALQKARWYEQRDQRRIEQLGKLTASLIGGGNFQRLLEEVTTTTAEVLEAQAASLFLLDKNSGKLIIRAAYGYHKPWLEHGAFYEIGEGITGGIAEKEKLFKVDSNEEFHEMLNYKDEYVKLQHCREPDSFLGIPLKMKEQVIGVMKIEDKISNQSYSTSIFTDEDVRLGEMMANIIAIVVYNTQLSEERLHDFSTSLRELSDVLAGSRHMPTLMDNIIKKIAQVLSVDAASLYLADETGTELVIQAAAGYQEPLVKEKVKYKWGQGVTGTIAATKKAIVTQSLMELRMIGGAQSGVYDHLHTGQLQPQSFYGLPLIVKEKEQAIGVLKVESMKERFFSNEDVLLIEMMANVIATVVYNAQQSEKRLRDFSTSLRELSEILTGSQDMPTLMDNIIKKIAQVLHVDAASLYLADETGTELVIQAAAGYQKSLVEKKVKYGWGQGVTGKIAANREAIVTQSLKELRHIGGQAKRGTYDHLHKEQFQPQSFYGLPLVVKEQERAIGVLKVESIQERFFSNEDVLLVEMMANVIASVVYNVQVSDAQLHQLSSDLEKLSKALAGGREMSDLVSQIVETTARVLGADASSLYLLDEMTGKLVIQAGTGHAKPLVTERATYSLGEGVTGWIAVRGELFRANNLDELHAHPAWKGKQNPLQEGWEPNSFLGLPLKVVDRFTGKEKVIGVLKMEDIGPSENHPEDFFTDQDVLLVTMMANTIATVVYNTQVNTAQLQKFSSNLEELSISLTGGQEMRDLVSQIVKTTARVLGAEASSLYLFDEATSKLIIQAATGYSTPLVADHAAYHAAEGITGWIAATGKLVRANTLDELHRHSNWKGKHTSYQRGREPNSFLGLPLKAIDRSTDEEKVIGTLKLENIVPSENHPESFFTDQDVLLATMMSNIIATVIYNTRSDEERIGNIIKKMGMLSEPVNAVPELLHELARSEDEGLIDQLAKAASLVLDKSPEQIETEVTALFETGAKLYLYERIAVWSKNDQVKWRFSLFHSVLATSTPFDNWEQVLGVAKPWLQIKEGSNNPQNFRVAVHALCIAIAEILELDLLEDASGQNAIWFGSVLNTNKIFGESITRIPLLFQRIGEFNKDNWDRMQSFAQQGFNRPYQILFLILWDDEIPEKQLQEMKDRMRNHAIDVVVANTSEILRLLESPNPTEAFRSLVLRQVTITSPFITEGSVPDTMFFGREQELRKIIEFVGTGRSCVLTGGRRIGKTSVLLRLSRVRLPDAGFYTLYHDCSTISSYEDFGAAPIESLRPALPSYASRTIDDLLKNPPTVDKPFILLLDEADKLIPFDRDNKWKLFNRLRALGHSGRVQIVLSGEPTLRDARRDSATPLFNIANEMVLGPLHFNEVAELVTRPIRQLEIELDNEDAIIHRIFDFTYGHPNVVQRLCSRLINRLNEQGSKLIRLDDVDAVIKDPDFIRKDFLETYFSRSSVLEQLCALFMASDNNLRTLNSVHKTLNENDVPALLNQIDTALECLVDLRNILKRTPEGYDFVVPAFPLIIAETERVSDWIALRREIFIHTGNIPPEIAPPELRGRLW